MKKFLLPKQSLFFLSSQIFFLLFTKIIMSSFQNTNDSFILDSDTNQESENINNEIYDDISISNESKKTRSEIWIHYNWNNIKSKAKCNYCG
jgi:hypothetical protein